MKRIALFIVIFITSLCSLRAQEYNQYGFMPKSVKHVFLSSDDADHSFVVMDADNNEVYKGKVGQAKLWEYSGNEVAVADLSKIKKDGQYRLLVDGDRKEIEFNIGGTTYSNVSNALLKSFYHARVSTKISKKYAGQYARKAGHPDTKVKVHSSAATAERPKGTIISSPGGWYDAGDYNKYIVNSGISTYTLLHMAELYPKLLDSMTLNIPESNNNTADALDETIINLRWMLTMQDPNDGGVYHKLTSKSFCGFIMPEEDNSERFVVMKSTAAALDFAATTAKAYRVLKSIDEDYPYLADSCLQMAIKAWQWAQKNPNVIFKNPGDISTGEYGDPDVSDEWFWAAAELYLSTKDNAYLGMLDFTSTKFSVPSWGSVATLGLYSLAVSSTKNGAVVNKAKGEVVKLADTYLNAYRQSAYKVPIHEFPWGSNGEVANEGMLLYHAYKLKKDKDYLEATDACAGYLLGANPLGYSFITGFGTKTPMHIHDRRSSADGIKEPVPGWVVGGPTKQAQNDCGIDKYPSEYPASSYVDLECSYSTNEIAINWNAPAAFLFVALYGELSK